MYCIKLTDFIAFALLLILIASIVLICKSLWIKLLTFSHLADAFILVNMVNSCDQLKSIAKNEQGTFPTNVKFPFAWIIEMTEFRSSSEQIKFDEIREPSDPA